MTTLPFVHLDLFEKFASLNSHGWSIGSEVPPIQNRTSNPKPVERSSRDDDGSIVAYHRVIEQWTEKTPGLAVHRVKSIKQWLITHIPSGLLIADDFRTKRDAEGASKLLGETGIDWTRCNLCVVDQTARIGVNIRAVISEHRTAIAPKPHQPASKAR